mgnify:CR=1 FL=1
MKRMIAFGAAGVAAVFLAGTAFVVLRGEDDPYATCRSSQVAGGDIGGPFELVNSAGETVTDADVIKEPALLYFGYTSCPDVCPLDVDRNAAATEILEERGQSITPVFITVDPARGERRSDGEPMRTLLRYRKGADNQVYFGQNLVAENEGDINVGETVDILE